MRQLVYTLPALADLRSILLYIADHSPQGVRHVQTRLRAIIDLLPLHPHIGSRTDDPAIRRMVASPYPYLIFYEIMDDRIIIHAVRHAARDPVGMPAGK